MNIKEVAKKAGVSITTVSRVLNNPNVVSDTTKKRVCAVMEELNYTPNWFARNLHNDKTGVIGMLLSDTLDSSNMDIARGVEKVARQKHYHMILCNTEFKKDIEKEYIETLVNRKIDGLVLASSMLEESDILQLKKRNIPFVLIGKTGFWESVNIVYTNYDHATEEAISYLLEMGRRSIAIVLAKSPHIDNNEKFKGYLNALKKFGLTYKENLVIFSENTLEGGYISTSKLLEVKEVPDAIFYSSDTMALGAIENLRKRGISPEAIGIIGYDDLQVGAIVEPKLTTITKPSYRMGLTGARLLFDLIEDDPMVHQEEPQIIMLQSRLKIRKSCGNKERLKEIW